MRRNLLAILAAAAFVLGLAATVTDVENGPAEIDLFGGSSGKVPFPHAAHQKRIKDCKVCHDLYPEKHDAIKAMKADGTLKAKKVMNLQCIKCHKAEKQAGKPHGPLTCKTCHVK